MCPVCITTAGLIAGGVASTGGLAARAWKKSGAKKAEAPSSTTPSREDRQV